MLEPGNERRGKIDPRAQNQGKMREHRHIGSLGDAVEPRGAPNATLVRRKVSAPNASSNPNTSTTASHGWRAKVELPPEIRS